MSTSRSLRLGRRGRLRVTRIESEDLLPLAPDECADFTKQQYCFAAGKYSSSTAKGGFFSESAMNFFQISKSQKKNIPKSYPELEI